MASVVKWSHIGAEAERSANICTPEILNMRQGMWEKVAKRSHYPKKLFPFGPGSDEVMLFGTVDYELKDGKKTTVEWSARSHFAEEDGQLKMDFYQVYLVGRSHSCADIPVNAVFRIPLPCRRRSE
jgi:hypothetical protein